MSPYPATDPTVTRLAQAGGITTLYLGAGALLPLVVEPAEPQLSLEAWAKTSREAIEQALLRHGAILFRGWNLPGPADFERSALAVYGELYSDYGDLPRASAGEKIYESTWYPNDQMILYHNESSHLNLWPMKISFFCVTPAAKGGCTPVFDTRGVCGAIDPKVLADLRTKGLLYVRNFSPGVDPTWQAFFHTEDRAKVEETCRSAGADFEWTAGDGLRISQKTHAVWRHPKTGEEIFFNQIQLHHIACVDPETREALRELYSDDELPRNVYYGDGSPIPDEVIEHLGRVFEKVAVRFQWQKGDMIMLDNMLTTHARDPFEGERKIVVAMGQMMSIEQALAAA
ncbi:MAG: TauD/TfdA family dioxygenase [Gemmatimonadales bacterium]